MDNFRVISDYTYSVYNGVTQSYDAGTVILLDERWAAMVNQDQPGTLERYEADTCPTYTPLPQK